MKTIHSLLLASWLLVMSSVSLSAHDPVTPRAHKHATDPDARPLVQLAILLDDSGSMSGLIDQARAHIWDVVYELSQTRKDGQPVRLQVALYHYGSVSFLHQPLLRFTDDLDQVSQTLFAINGGGGEERCGEVIRNAARQLAWSSDPETLKLIYIAGNEPFIQGPVHYGEAIAAARERGIVVNTIHCGEAASGRQGSWHVGAQLGGGDYHNINHNARQFDFQSPQDARIDALNQQLNTTYIPYGAEGRQRQASQVAEDTNAQQLGASAYTQRAAAKASGMYRNTGWDLVDAVAEDDAVLEKVTPEQLPEALRGQTREELSAAVAEAAAKREQIQAELGKLVRARQAHIEAERERLAAEGAGTTLGQALVESLRQQAAAHGYESSPSSTEQEVQP